MRVTRQEMVEGFRRAIEELESFGESPSQDPSETEDQYMSRLARMIFLQMEDAGFMFYNDRMVSSGHKGRTYGR